MDNLLEAIAGGSSSRNKIVGTTGIDYNQLSKLERHVDEFRWTPNDGSTRVEEYTLFSRSGFKRSVEEGTTERDDIRLFTVGDVVDAL